MRHFILFSILFFFVSSCAWWKDCDTCFIKDKRSKRKSTVFSQERDIETRPIYLFLQNNRMLEIAFKVSDNKSNVIISQRTDENSFKNSFVLGSEIKLGFVFDNKENYILSFDGAENKNERGTNKVSSNMAVIDNELHELLKTKEIISLEIQNPFLSNNATKVKQWDVVTGPQIKIIYNCFLQEKNN